MYEGLIGTFGVLRNRVRAWHAEGGVPLAARNLFALAFKVVLTPVIAAIRGRRTFRFRGREYRYFIHWYNTTFDNERAVEVAMAEALLRASGGKRVLEVGNVLSHYLGCSHDVLDKYEKGPGVINEDVATFRPDTLYDLIVSISTMEHVGFDERVRDTDKFRRAVKNLHGCLAPGGLLMITVPVGYNPSIHGELRPGDLFQEVFAMRRISKANDWEECGAEEAFGHRFNAPYSFGNAIILAFYRAPV